VSASALSEQPQEELFYLFNEHLARLERSPTSQVLAHLTHAVFQLLVLAGVAPQVHLCCLTRDLLLPNLDDHHWRIGFSIPAGGTVTLAQLEQLLAKPAPRRHQVAETAVRVPQVGEPHAMSDTTAVTSRPVKVYQPSQAIASLHRRLSAPELMLMQHLAEATVA
jgi:DNA repair protein RecO (recombination protein O)